MRKILIALVMATIAISLCVNVAYGMEVGFSEEGTFSSGYPQTYFSKNFTLAAPDGAFVMLDSVWAYVANTSAGQYVQGGVYYAASSYSVKLSEKVLVNGADWYELPLNAECLPGNYVMSLYVDDGINYSTTTVTGWNGNYTTGITALPYLQSFTTEKLNTAYSFYLTYHYLLPGGNLATDVVTLSTVNWMTFGGLIFLSLVCLLLAWKSKIPIINIVFGIIALGTSAYLLQSELIFGGFGNLTTILMATLCILSGAMSLRDT